MARIPIYDSQATVNSNNVPIIQALLVSTPRRSMPVRLSGLPQPLYNISYEWLFEGQGSWAFSWYQEFWGDKAIFAPPPDLRTDPTINANTAWPREQLEIVQATTNTILCVDLSRTMTVVPTLATPVTKWFMMGLFVPFVRLAIQLETTPPQGSTLPRVRVWAHVGGYEGKYFEQLTAPYGGEYGL